MKRPCHAPAFALLTALAACESPEHDMYQQAKLQEQAPSTLFADGRAAQQPPLGTVAMAEGRLADASAGMAGQAQLPAASSPGRATPFLAGGARPAQAARATLAQLQRGRERYEINCAPCHGLLGDGDGIVAQRGFPHPPSYHTPRLREAPDAHLAEVIRDGYGLMFPYGDRVGADDRAAIVAYIRALQFSQHAPASILPAQDRQALGLAP